MSSVAPTTDGPPSAPADPPPRPKGRLATLVGIGAIPAVIGVLIGTGALGRLIPQDPYEQAAEELGAEMAEMPGFEERFGDLDRDEAFQAGSELGAAAIPRLSDAQLQEWLDISRQLLAALDVDGCAAVMRGETSDPDQALEVFRTLDIDTFRRYLDIIAAGARVELTGAPSAPEPTQAQIDGAFGALVEELGAERLTEIDQALANPDAASAADTCAAGRDLFDALDSIDPANRNVLIRFVAGSTAP